MSEERSEYKNQITIMDIPSDIHMIWMLRIYQLGLVILVPYLVYGGIVLIRSGLSMLIALPILALIALGIGAINKLKGHSIRAWIITCILFGLGIIDLILFGWKSDARLFMLGSMIVASLLMQKNAGYGFWCGASALTFVYMVISYTGWVIPVADVSADAFSMRMLREWIFFLCIGGSFTAAITFGLTRFRTAFDMLQASSGELRNEREALTARTAELQQLADTFHKQETILDATASVTRAITANQPLRSFLALTVDLLTKYYGFEHTAIYLVDETEAWVVMQAASSEAGKKLLAQGFRVHIDDMSMVGWVAHHRMIKHSAFDGEGEAPPFPEWSALHAEAALPLLIDDELVGVLDLQTSMPEAFDDYTMHVLQNLTLEFTLVMSAIRRLEGVPMEDMTQPFYHAGQQIMAAQTDRAIYEAAVHALEPHKASRLTFVRKNRTSSAFSTAFDRVNGQLSFACQPVEALDMAVLNEMVQYGSHLEKPAWLDETKFDVWELPEELTQNVLKSQGVESAAIIPVRTSHCFLGVFIILHDHPHAFNSLEMRLYRFVAELSALALERNALIEVDRKRTDYEHALGRVRNQLRLLLDPHAVLRMTIQELGRLLGAELALVDLSVSDHSQIPEMGQSESGWLNSGLQPGDRGFIYDGISVQPLQPQERLDERIDLVIPLTSARKALGSIKIKLPDNGVINDLDAELARAIALEAGRALESARMYVETQAALKEVSDLYRAIQGVSAAKTTDEVLSAFANNLVPHDIDRCMLLVKVATGGDVEDRYARIESAWEPVTVTSPVVGQVWDMQELPFITHDICVISDIETSTNLDALSKSTLLAKGLRAIMVVPLDTGEEITGWLLIGMLHTEYAFTRRQIRLYSNFAHQLTQALAHILLVQTTEQRMLEDQLAREAVEHMREPVELQDVLDVAAEEIRRILDLDDVVIHLTMPESDEPHYQMAKSE